MKNAQIITGPLASLPGLSCLFSFFHGWFLYSSQRGIGMDLSQQNYRKRLVLRMSHYLERLHGAAIPDPDLTMEVYLLAETVGVLTYCDC